MIRFADERDIDRIMSFIDVYWRKGHILGNNRNFFEYEHLLPEGVTYVISEDDNQINGILGYIPYGKKNRDLMTVMWKVNHTAKSSLGLELLKFLKDNGDVRLMASPGSNPKLKGLYRYLGYQFGKMIQWYRLRRQEKYHVAVIENDMIPMAHEGANYIELKSWEILKKHFDFDAYTNLTKPYKEEWYIKKRYYCHPIYKYNVYGVFDKNEKVSLLVIFRIIQVDGINIIRLIDCIGDFSLIGHLSRLMDNILEKYNAEYVDCYETGIADEEMIKAGWLKTVGSGNIIPNYFSPFVQENIDIYYFSSEPGIVLFKGDGDQDRPN